MAAVAGETSEGFGITLQDLTSQMMRRLGVPDTIEAGRTAFLLVQRRDTRVFLQTAEGSVTGVDGLAGAAG